MIKILDFIEKYNLMVVKGSNHYGNDLGNSWEYKFHSNKHHVSAVWDVDTKEVVQLEIKHIPSYQTYIWVKPEYEYEYFKQLAVDGYEVIQAYSFNKFCIMFEEAANDSEINFDNLNFVDIELSSDLLEDFQKLAKEKNVSFDMLLSQAISDFSNR
jgi:hypothetical protein